jgi:glycosyltransferase involved in cell wall biosynthesis
MKDTGRILFDISILQRVATGSFHGGREHCEAILNAIVSKTGGENLTVYCKSYNLIPDRVKGLLNDYSLKPVIAKDSRGLHKELSGLKYKVHFVCQDDPLDNALTIPSDKNIILLFGFRGIEMPTDVFEGNYSCNLTEYAKYIFKRYACDLYRQKFEDKWRLFFRNSRIDKLITNSRHTKYSLLSFASDLVDADSIVTLYPPPQIKTEAEAVNFSAMKCSPKEFFLVIIGNRWIKNSARAVKALDELYTMRPNLQKKTIVLGCNQKDRFVIPVRNSNRFVFKEYVSHGQLQTYYANAFAFIYPTLNEGFGYPPLDAMRYGVPVLASAISAIPETCSDAVHYFNPFSVHEIKSRIMEVIDSKSLREELVEKGLHRFVLMEDLQKRNLETLVSLILKSEF